MYLVYRIGDADDYHCCDDFEAFADVLAEFFTDLSGTDVRQRNVGLEISDWGYDGCDYISLFWGDENFEIERSLTDDEYRELFTLLEDRP